MTLYFANVAKILRHFFNGAIITTLIIISTDFNYELQIRRFYAMFNDFNV